MRTTLLDEMGLIENVDITFKRCALTLEQIEADNLPHNPDALKWTDSRAGKYVNEFGEIAVELDALHPDRLQALIRDAIEAELDLDLFEEQRELETREQEALEEKKERVEALLREEF